MHYGRWKRVLLKSFTAIILFTSMVAGQRIYSTGRSIPSYTTAQEATDAEIYLKSHPEDRTVVQMLLGRIVCESFSGPLRIIPT